MEQAILTTARLHLVPLADEHLEHEIELDSDPEVMRFLAAGASTRESTARAHRNRLEQARTMPGMGLWIGFSHGQFSGWWLLRPRSHTPGDTDIELGYRLLPRFLAPGPGQRGQPGAHPTRLRGPGRRTRLRRDHGRQPGIPRDHDLGRLRYARAFRHERDPARLRAEHGDVEYAITREQWLSGRS